MSKIDKSLSNVFGVDPFFEEKKEIIDVVEVNPEERAIQVAMDPDADDLEKDAAMIRNNLHGLIRNGNEAFEAIIHIAKAEERVSAFEVSNSLLANLAQINMQLLHLHERKKKIKMSSIKDDSGKGQIVNNGGTTNIAFVGTTKELFEKLKSMPSEETPKDDE